MHPTAGIFRDILDLAAHLNDKNFPGWKRNKKGQSV